MLASTRRRLVLLLWDRLPAHRSRVIEQTLAGQKAWLRVEWLPAYAPELNPVELLWNHLDTTALANTPVEDLVRLARRLHRGLRQLRARPTVTRGFLKHTHLF